MCLIPDDYRWLLSAIGIAGWIAWYRRMSLHVREAVEAAGDVDVLLFDKTGTITLGNRQATMFLPAQGVPIRHSRTLHKCRRWLMKPSEGRSIVVLAKEKYGYVT